MRTSAPEAWQRSWIAASALIMVSGCAASSKSAPPAESGPTTTIGAAGGALDVTTPEGVTIHLEVPAHALARDVVFTTSPRPAGDGEQFRVAIDPPGLVFKVPATLTVTLPSGSFPADSTLTAIAAGMTRRTWFPATVSADRKTLTASLSVLGASVAAPSATSGAVGTSRSMASARAGLTTADWQGFLLVAAAMPTDQLLAQLHTYVVQLIADARFDDAVVLSLGARVIIDRLGTDTTGWSSAEQQFWQDLKSAVCSGELATIARVDSVQPQCVWQSREPSKDLLSAMALEQQLGVTCGDGESNTPQSALDRLLRRTISFVDDPTHRQAFVACECNDPARLADERAGTRRRPPECGAAPVAQAAPAGLARAAPAALATVFDRTTAGYEWKLLLETVTLTADDFTPLRVIEYTNDAARATSQLGGGVVDAVRHFAFSLCLDDQDSSILEALWRRVAQLEAPLSDVTAAIRSDAQWCGASLHVVAEKADHSQAATVDIPVPTGPGGSEPEGSIIAPADGKLFLTGPIATLRCRDPGTMETISLASDELSFRSEVGALHRDIASVQANRADNVLGTTPAVQVQVGFELGALNLPTQDSSFDVVLERSGGGCGFDAPATNEVMRVHVSTDLPVTLSLGGLNDHFPGDPPRTGTVGVVPNNSALLRAKLLRGETPMRDKTVVFRKHDFTAGSATDVGTLTTDPWGEATVTAPRPAEGAYDAYYAFWSQDGRDCPDPYAGSSTPPPRQCHVASIGVTPTVGIVVAGSPSMDKGGTFKFTATPNAGTSQGVTWSVDGLGSIASDGTFTAGQVAGDFIVTATSAASATLTGTGKGHVKLTNTDYLGVWTGTSTIVGPTSPYTAPDGNQYVAGHLYSECTGGSLTMSVFEGNGIAAPIGKLQVLFGPCGDGTMVGQANDRYFYVGSPSNVCEDWVQTSSVTYTTGSGATTMHGMVEIFDCRTNWSWVTREFQLTRGP